MLIYLDNNATTQPSKTVIDAVLPYLRECYFNASSAPFTGADKPRANAATALAHLLNAEDPNCFTFTSGATESNNWALTSVCKGGEKGRVIISTIEHPSITEPARELAKVGLDLIEVPVDQDGLVRLDSLINALHDDTIFISIIAANNETGVLQPIREIGRIIRDRCPAAIFHTDATQAVGKSVIDLQDDWQDVDLLSFSGHKFHAPKGIGGIYLRPGIEIVPMMLGGGQQQGLRPGTLNTAGLAGLAQAANEANANSFEHIESLRNQFEAHLKEGFSDAIIHSARAPRLPNTTFFSLPGIVAGDAVDILGSAGIIVGTGSACSYGAIQPSKTLQAMQVTHELALSAMRVSLSRFSTSEEISHLLRALQTLTRKALAGHCTHAQPGSRLL
jgi:cysteine desulfurase